MAKVLVIDDDRMIRRIIEKSLSSLGYEVVTADSGEEGLNQIKAIDPDVVITDKVMPGIDGFEVTRRLRRQPEFTHIPILVLTGDQELKDKLEAFEAGADDYLSKPFEKAELAARLTVLLRRSEALKAAQMQVLETSELARVIAVHTLRGGIGASSLAVNMALCLQNLWQSATLLVDGVLNSGQIALMLNNPVKYTWVSLAQYDASELDFSSISGIIGKHQSGLNFIGSPASPTEAEKVPPELIGNTINLLTPRYRYIVADLPHDFSGPSLQLLDVAHSIVLLLSPEMASIRSAAIALDTYDKLGYEPENIKLVLNWTFEQGGVAKKKIETALKHPIDMVLPFAPTRFVTAINRGVPLVQNQPEDPVSTIIEDFAFRQSKETDRSIPPASPSTAWHRVNNRLQLFNTAQKKSKTRNLFAST